MVIEFDKMNEAVATGVMGGKGNMKTKMFVNALGKICYAKLEPGASTGMHRHITSSEIIYIISGKADILFDDGTETVTAGNCHYCPKGHSHSMINNTGEELVFFAVVPEQ